MSCWVRGACGSQPPACTPRPRSSTLKCSACALGRPALSRAVLSLSRLTRALRPQLPPGPVAPHPLRAGVSWEAEPSPRPCPRVAGATRRRSTSRTRRRVPGSQVAPVILRPAPSVRPSVHLLGPWLPGARPATPPGLAPEGLCPSPPEPRTFCQHLCDRMPCTTARTPSEASAGRAQPVAGSQAVSVSVESPLKQFAAVTVAAAAEPDLLGIRRAAASPGAPSADGALPACLELRGSRSTS